MSADTLRRLVELARIKQQRQDEAAARSPRDSHRSSYGTPHHNGHNMSRGKSLAHGLSPRDPEEKVKKRLSITNPNNLGQIRSFSLPKGALLPDGNHGNDHLDDPHDPHHTRLESNDSGSTFDNTYDRSEPDLNVPRNSDRSSERGYNNGKRDSKTVSASYSTASYTQSQSASIGAGNQQQYFTLKESKPGEYRKEMSVASHSSTMSNSYSSTYHSNASFNTQDNGFPPPMLDNISEASGWDTNSNYWAESVPGSTRSNSGGTAVVQAAFEDKKRPSFSDDPTRDPDVEQVANTGGFFSCFPCLRKQPQGKALQQLRSNTALVDMEPRVVVREHTSEQIFNEVERKSRPEQPVKPAVSSSLPPPPMLDQLTATTASRLRRPTQFSQRTLAVDDTMSENDVHMWPEPFGRGASGRVFKAIYLPMCTLVACKVTSSLSKDTIKQLLQECRAQIETLPDIDQLLKILGWFRDQETNEFVIALEYMDLGSVFDSCFLDSPAAEQAREREIDADYTHEEVNNSGHKPVFVNKLSYDQIRHIAREILLAMHVLHTQARPLIHRDIKPQNILIASTGEVKLADFGLLYQLRRKDASCKDSKGTRKYFSPERIDCEFGVASDVWAFGVTMIEILQQRLISPHLLNDFKIQQGLQPTEFLGTTVPTEFVSFIGACLQKNPLKRPPAQILLTHPYIKGSWGIPAVPTGPSLDVRVLPVTFLEIEPDHGMLDTFLAWLELWILEDDEGNANLFLLGDDLDLLRCLESMAKWTGFGTKYIETLITEQYREFMDTV